ncbi:MAG: diguanylate cyclase [Tahibacter sp.]
MWQRMGDGIRVTAIALLIGSATWLTISLARPDGGVAIVWAVGGVLTGILLKSPHRLWVAYLIAALLGGLLARYLWGDPLLSVIGRSLASTIEAGVVAYALRHAVGEVSAPENLTRVAWVALSATAFGCLVGALLVAITGASPNDHAFQMIVSTWFAAHTLGMVIFATLIVVASELHREGFGRVAYYGKFARSMGLVIATTLWVFTQSRYPLLFLTYPPLLLAVFRHRFAGFAFGITFVLVISIIATQSGHGPMMLAAALTPTERFLLLQVFIAITCLTTLPVAVVLAERGRLTAELRDSEYNYRLLADYSRDLVVRLLPDGRRLYVSPSVKEVLGYEPRDLLQPRWDLVHPDDRATLVDTMGHLFRDGGTATVVYRALHQRGNYVWIEAIGRRVPSAQPGCTHEVIYVGRDVSRRIVAEQSLTASERRLRAIADNLPAMVIQVDAAQRYTYVNAQFARLFAIDPALVIGRTMQEIVDPKLYPTILPNIEAALRGERVTFEGEIFANGKRYYRQANYVPDVEADGSVVGFYSLTYDITELQAAKEELVRIAQHDNLTGLANRNQFNERLAIALVKSHRHRNPIALIYLDIDHFKEINDCFGHAVGDAVLREFSSRLRESVRATDLPVRLGGDEFVVLIEDADTPDNAKAVAQKLLDAMRRDFIVEPASLRVGASIGVAYTRTPPAADALLKVADYALYAAKIAGRDTFRFIDMDDEAVAMTLPPPPKAPRQFVDSIGEQGSELA